MSVLKKNRTSSFIWSAIDRFGVIFLTFIFNWILSRFFLTPEDFGLVGMISVFIALANTTVVGGFGQALIQSKSPQKKDFSTVFVWQLIMGFVLFFILYISAPIIAEFYDMSILSPILRWMALILIINSFIVSPNSYLIKIMNFKRLGLINLIASFCGCCVGVCFAYKGYGVWSLVVTTLAIQSFTALLLLFFSGLKFSLFFDYKSFKSLFSFGGFMYLSSLLTDLYNNFSYVIIGKMFSVNLLGFFTQAEKLQRVPTNTISTIINQVSFPLFSSFQDNLDELKVQVKKNIQIVAFINSMIVGLLILIAKPLVLFLYSSKWESSIPMFQILCLSGLFMPISITNSTVLKAIGNSKMYFYLQIIQRVIGLLVIFFSSMINIFALLYGLCFSSFLFFLMNAFFVSKKIPYSFIAQLLDVGIIMLSSLISFFISIKVLSYFIISIYILEVLIGSLVFSTIFLIISYFLKIEPFFYFKSIVCERLKGNAYQ